MTRIEGVICDKTRRILIREPKIGHTQRLLRISQHINLSDIYTAALAKSIL